MIRHTIAHHAARLAGGLICAASASFGAEISTYDRAPLKPLIHVTGEIVEGDSDAFLAIAQDLPEAVVILESPGGALLEGLVIGRAIRTEGFSTGVAPETACASACALAWLAGTPRMMDPAALIGFHAAYTQTDGQLLESGLGNALLGAYLAELGLGFDAVVFVASAGPEEMNWLNLAMARNVGIDVSLPDGSGQTDTGADAVELKLPTGYRWIVMESSADPDALRLRAEADQVVRTRNSYFASVIGPYERSVAEDLKQNLGLVPADAYLSSGNGFLFSLTD